MLKHLRKFTQRVKPATQPLSSAQPTSCVPRPINAAIVNPDCQKFEVNNWILSEFVVQHLVPVVGLHPFPVNELLLMSSAVCRIRPKHIFEWGTHIGRSARVFYETSKWLGQDTTVHSIDLPDEVEHVEHPGQERGKLVRDIPQVKLYQGDGLEVALKLGRSFSQNEPFLFFLDGDHSYESVFRELSGLIDAFPSSSFLVHDSFYQSPDSRYNVGPYQAIQSILEGRRDDFQVLPTNTGLPGMTLLYNLRK